VQGKKKPGLATRVTIVPVGLQIARKINRLGAGTTKSTQTHVASFL
jgi:hypothetical protein